MFGKKLSTDEDEDVVDESHAFVIKRKEHGESSELMFNADLFKTHKRVSRKLTAHAREILSSDPAERTEEDIREMQVRKGTR